MFTRLKEHRDHIPPQKVLALYEKFRKAEFYRLYDVYASGATDLPEYSLEISFDGQHRKVIDYGGVAVGMPQVVRDLENEIDKAAGTGRWIRAPNEAIFTPVSEPSRPPLHLEKIEPPAAPKIPTFDILPENAANTRQTAPTIDSQGTNP